MLPDGCMDLVWTGAELLVAGPDTAPHPYRPAGRPDRGRAALRARAAAGPARGARRGAARPAGAAGRAASGLARAGHRPARGRRRPRPPCWPELALALPGAATGAGGAGGAADWSRRGRSAAEAADALGWTTRSLHRRCLAWFGYGPAVLRRVLRFRAAAALLRARVAPPRSRPAPVTPTSRTCPGRCGRWPAPAVRPGQLASGGEEVHAVAVRVEHHGVALAPEPVERRQLASSGRHQLGVGRRPGRRVGQRERQARPPAAHRRPVRVERADLVLGVEQQPQPTGQPDLDVPLSVAPRGHASPSLPVEGQGLAHVRHHDPDRVQPRFSAHDRKPRRRRGPRS